MSGLVCGLDVHKSCCDATIVDWFGNMVESRRLPRDEVYYFLSSKRVSLVAMESSSYVHPMYRRLRDMGLKVFVAHPRNTRLIAENRLKSDRSDSRSLAELARLGALPRSYIPEGDVARVRELVRRRAFLVRIRTRLRNRIIATLALEGVDVPRVSVRISIFTHLRS
ncbi:MAG: transposase [Candidatus Caldarchaeum sp.]|jgi:transposase